MFALSVSSLLLKNQFWIIRANFRTGEAYAGDIGKLKAEI